MTAIRLGSRSRYAFAVRAASHCVSRISQSRLLSLTLPSGSEAEPFGVYGVCGRSAGAADVLNPRAV